MQLSCKDNHHISDSTNRGLGSCWKSCSGVLAKQSIRYGAPDWVICKQELHSACHNYSVVSPARYTHDRACSGSPDSFHPLQVLSMLCVHTGQRAVQRNTARGRRGNGLQCTSVAPQAHSGSQKRPYLSSSSAPHVCGAGGGQDPGLAAAHSSRLDSPSAAVCLQQRAC